MAVKKVDLRTIITRKRAKWFLIVVSSLIASVLSIILSITLGAVSIPPTDVAGVIFGNILHISKPVSSIYYTIIVDVRLPRVLLAAAVGAGLCVSGVALQAIFRNPMASPFVLGISTSASFGAALSLLLGIEFAGFGTPLVAFLFAMLTLFMVYNLSRVGGRLDVETLLLAGVATSLFFSALVSLAQYLAGEELRGIVVWLMGGLWQATWKSALITIPVIIVGIIAVSLFSRALNLLTIDESSALDLGLDVEKVKRIMLVLTSIIIAIAVSFTGPIGFVGLIIPHATRILVGVDHRILISSSCFGGAMFLIWTDTFARTVAKPIEIPVGIITAACGAPFFIYLLRRRKKW